MKIIREYLLDKESCRVQELYLPIGAEIISVQSDYYRGLRLVALINATASVTELRTFKICEPEDKVWEEAIKYVGSFNNGKYIIEIF
jgi:hypothetical protein